MDQDNHQNDHDDVCLGLGLGLGLGLSGYTVPKKDHNPGRKINKKRLYLFDLSTSTTQFHYQNITDHGMISTVDSSSNLKIIGEDEKQGSKNNSSLGSKEDDDSNCSRDFSRKKLRLTRDQTTVLEDSFKQHTTLNTAQKQALAGKLNLKPRQVEVWFQNRRARTKLKQTEVDCQYLKKNCERLSEENRRLKKEVLELRSLLKTTTERPPPPSTAVPFFHHSPKVAEKNGKNRGGGEKVQNAAAVMEVVHQS